ncbi:MAG: hypothetical protein ACC655_01670 [Rhodothermia bacterium]
MHRAKGVAKLIVRPEIGTSFLRKPPVACGLLLLVVTAGVSSNSQAQRRLLTTGFQSDASRYVWTAGLVLDQRGRDWTFYVSNDFLSEAFLLSRQVNEVRDENYTIARISRSLNRTFSAIGLGEGSWFSQNSSSTVEGYGGFRFVPRPYLMLESAAGAVVDRKPGLLLEGQIRPDILADSGPGIHLAGAITDRKVGGFLFGATTNNRWHFINPRFGRSLNAAAVASRDFDHGLLRVDISFGDLVRESYEASSFLNRFEGIRRSDDTIESTKSDTVDGSLRLEYALSKKWRFLTTASFLANRRFVRTRRAPKDELFFDTNFDRQVADLQAILVYDDRRSSIQLTASRAVTVERRRLDNADELPPGQAVQKIQVLRQADFDRGIFWVEAIARRGVNRWLAIRGSYRASILRHDTPLTNRDDRDESLFDAQLGLVFFLHKSLEADVRVFAVQHHTVYLDRSRSGENQSRRSLRLVPGMRWRPDDQTDFRLRAEVRAVYTTDDFDFADQPKNDQSARELKYSGSLSRKLGSGAELLLDASYSQLMLGRLLWEDFEEVPFDSIGTRSAWARLEVGRRWRAEFGVRLFYRTEYERTLSVRFEPPGADGTTEIISRPGRKRLLQIGPTGSFSLPLSKNSELRMAGWIQFQETRLTLYGDLPPDDAQAIIEAGLRAERRTIPNLTISVLWNL